MGYPGQFFKICRPEDPLPSGDGLLDVQFSGFGLSSLMQHESERLMGDGQTQVIAYFFGHPKSSVGQAEGFGLLAHIHQQAGQVEGHGGLQVAEGSRGPRGICAVPEALEHVPVTSYGLFAPAVIEVKQRKKTVTVDQDEEPFRADLEKMPSLTTSALLALPFHSITQEERLFGRLQLDPSRPASQAMR